MLLTLLSSAFLGGIILGLRLPPSLLFALGAGTLFTLLFFIRDKRRLTLSVACLISLALGVIRFEVSKPEGNLPNIDSFRDLGEIQIRGIISRDPEAGKKTVHLYLDSLEVKPEGSWEKVSGRLLAFVPRYSEYHYGDALELKGELKLPPDFEDFGYREYLAQQQIFVTVLYPDVRIYGREKGSKVLSLIYTLRQKMSEGIRGALPEPESSLTEGILLGIRGNIPDSVKEDFVRSGIMHLLAISGANLSIVAGMLAPVIASLFGRRYNVHILLTLSVIWGYSLLTGFEPPVIRSAVMGSLFLAAELLGRQKSALAALFFSAAVMTAFSPEILRDASFQLSFLATGGLILLFPHLRQFSRRKINSLTPDKGIKKFLAYAVSDSFSMSLSALLFVLPLTSRYFGGISLASLPATLLAIPMLPAIIISGALTGFSGLIYLPLAGVFGFLAHLAATYLLLVTRLFAAIPFSFLEVEKPGIYPLLAYYLAVGLLLLFLNRRRINPSEIETLDFYSSGGLASKLRWLTVPLAFILLASWLIPLFKPGSTLQITFLDVGQGDAILIHQGLTQVLIDGGGDETVLLSELGRRMPFWDRSIELVVLTHPDSDHLTGLLPVLKRYRVQKALYPQGDYASEPAARWLRLLKDKNVKGILARRGQEISLNGTRIEVISPGEVRAENEDDDSVVLRVSQGKVSFLLTGDITSERELDLIFERTNLRSTVLKVAHHGSGSSTSREFLAVVHPEAAVISVGAGNRYGHPEEEVLKRLRAGLEPDYIYRTDEQGTVEFATDGEVLRVKTAK